MYRIQTISAGPSPHQLHHTAALVAERNVLNVSISYKTKQICLFDNIFPDGVADIDLFSKYLVVFNVMTTKGMIESI